MVNQVDANTEVRVPDSENSVSQSSSSLVDRDQVARRLALDIKGIELANSPSKFINKFFKILPRIPSFRDAAAKAVVRGEKDVTWDLPDGQQCYYGYNPEVYIHTRLPYGETEGYIEWTQEQLLFKITDPSRGLTAVDLTTYVGTNIPDDKDPVTYVEVHPAMDSGIEKKRYLEEDDKNNVVREALVTLLRYADPQQ